MKRTAPRTDIVTEVTLTCYCLSTKEIETNIIDVRGFTSPAEVEAYLQDLCASMGCKYLEYVVNDIRTSIPAEERSHTMNKLEENIFYQYLNSHKTTLCDCYAKPSAQKKKIYEQIRSNMHVVGGKNFRILSHDGWCFSCAYLYKADGNVYLAVFSPSKNFDIDVTDTVLGTQI